MDEEHKLSGKTKAIMFCAGVIAFAGLVKFATDTNKKYKRQKALEEYLEHIGLLEAAKRRLLRISNDPDKTEDDFLDAVAEEKRFLGIITED